MFTLWLRNLAETITSDWVPEQGDSETLWKIPRLLQVREEDLPSAIRFSIQSPEGAIPKIAALGMARAPASQARGGGQLEQASRSYSLAVL